MGLNLATVGRFVCMVAFIRSLLNFVLDFRPHLLIWSMYQTRLKIKGINCPKTFHLLYPYGVLWKVEYVTLNFDDYDCKPLIRTNGGDWTRSMRWLEEDTRMLEQNVRPAWLYGGIGFMLLAHCPMFCNICQPRVCSITLRTSSVLWWLKDDA